MQVVSRSLLLTAKLNDVYNKVHLHHLIAATVQIFHGTGEARGNDKAVEQAMKDWLKQASNRLKQ